MLKAKTRGWKSIIMASLGAFVLLVANLNTAKAAESGCVTCHLDKEMLQKTAKVEKGAKSAMQSGAG